MGVPTRGIGVKSQDKLFQLFNQGYTIPEVLEKALETKLLAKRGLNGLREFNRLYRLLSESASDIKPVQWLKCLIDELDFCRYLEKQDESTVEYRAANVDELLESMRELEAQGVTTLSQFMDFSALVNDQDEFDENEPKLSLMTIHAAKGLEFDTIFVIGLEEGVFPNQRSISENPNALEEERRLFYVAVTRARKRLYLSYARRRQTYGSTTSNPKSRFLVAPGAAVEANDYDEASDDFTKPDKTKRKVRLAALSDQIERMKEQLREHAAEADFDKVNRSQTLRIGDTVRHKTFGTGTVSSVRGSGDLQTVSVYFPGLGKKTLVAKVAKLVKLG